jgi:hypothetical protein
MSRELGHSFSRCHIFQMDVKGQRTDQPLTRLPRCRIWKMGGAKMNNRATETTPLLSLWKDFNKNDVKWNLLDKSKKMFRNRPRPPRHCPCEKTLITSCIKNQARDFAGISNMGTDGQTNGVSFRGACSRLKSMWIGIPWKRQWKWH